MTGSTREAVLAAARRHLRPPEITAAQALVIGFAECAGEPLDPYSFDDAALILRAERLVLEDVPVGDALATARAEEATFALGGEA